MALMLSSHALRTLSAGALLSLTATTALAAEDRYGYDELGRLSSVRYEDGLCAIYTYDANGNLTRRIREAAPLAPPTLWNGADWNDFNWTSAPHWGVWGEGGTWGCLEWNQ